MKYKIIITVILFIFSFIYIKYGIYLLKENDRLMKLLKEKQSVYNKDPIDAIITTHTMIPGISGKRINLEKSYQRMKKINKFRESLLVFNEIKPNKRIDNIFDKVIISGNQNVNKIGIVLEDDSKYCYTTNLEIICNNKYNILVNKIYNNHLTKVKEKVHNGIIFYLENITTNELNLIIKYLKNNNYEIVTINELLKE